MLHHTTSRRRFLAMSGAFMSAGAVGAFTAAGTEGAAGAAAVDGRRVAVIGDSLTVGTKAAGLGTMMRTAGFGVTAIDAEVGRTTSTGVGLISSYADRSDVLVLALGTNDVASGLSASNFTALIDRALDIWGTSKPLLWVDVALYRTGLEITKTAKYNAVLDGFESTYDTFTRVRWTATIAGHATWWAGDHVHLTSAAYRQRSTVIVDELENAVDDTAATVSPEDTSAGLAADRSASRCVS